MQHCRMDASKGPLVGSVTSFTDRIALPPCATGRRRTGQTRAVHARRRSECSPGCACHQNWQGALRTSPSCLAWRKSCMYTRQQSAGRCGLMVVCLNDGRQQLWWHASPKPPQVRSQTPWSRCTKHWPWRLLLARCALCDGTLFCHRKDRELLQEVPCTACGEADQWRA